MAFQAKYDVYKIIEYRDGCVYKTRKVDSIWLDVKSRTYEEEVKIAKEHGGDILANTVESRIV